jgi:uncharacterized membrane protein
MSAVALEWVNLVIRWVHVVAAIMWIGDSFLFMWMDSHLSSPARKREGDVAGELWLTHSGGFYEVVKRKSLAQEELPPTLYWFKWESYTTWLSGFCLLVVVYHLNGAALLIDPGVRALLPWQATLISLGSLPLAYGVYELLWKTPLARNGRAFALVGLALLSAAAHGFTELFSGRGAFLQMGAVMGTLMAANVFFRIIPAQRHMLAATRAGTKVDTSYGARAKGRSVQNHYLTLPVLFTMLSNHFPSTYGSGRPWQVLTCLFVFGAGLKYVMNLRGQTPAWAAVGTLGAMGGAVFLSWPASPAAVKAYEGRPTVSYATIHAILDARCVSCHAEHPGSPLFAAPPQGVVLTSDEAVAARAERIFLRAVVTKTMPLGNATGMTEGERELLGTWYAQGADVHAKGDVALTPPAASPAPVPSAARSAKEKFAQTCVACHGEKGDGAGPAAVALNPKPRNFRDVAWQASVTDDQIRLVILGGGPVRKKSALMPSFAELHTDPALLEGLVGTIRGFGQDAAREIH